MGVTSLRLGSRGVQTSHHDHVAKDMAAFMAINAICSGGRPSTCCVTVMFAGGTQRPWLSWFAQMKPRRALLENSSGGSARDGTSPGNVRSHKPPPSPRSFASTRLLRGELLCHAKYRQGRHSMFVDCSESPAIGFGLTNAYAACTPEPKH